MACDHASRDLIGKTDRKSKQRQPPEDAEMSPRTNHVGEKEAPVKHNGQTAEDKGDRHEPYQKPQRSEQRVQSVQQRFGIEEMPAAGLARPAFLLNRRSRRSDFLVHIMGDVDLVFRGCRLAATVLEQLPARQHLYELLDILAPVVKVEPVIAFLAKILRAIGPAQAR